MPTSIINQQSKSSVLLERTLGMPEEGPKCIPIALDFASFDTYILDYSNMQQRAFFGLLQTLWVDNFGNGAVITITVPATQQRLVIPAGVQGYFTIVCPNPIKISINSTGGTVQQIILLNFPVLG